MDCAFTKILCDDTYAATIRINQSAKDSCFALIGTHQCSVLMVAAGLQLLLYPLQVKELWLQQKQVEAYQS